MPRGFIGRLRLIAMFFGETRRCVDVSRASDLCGMVMIHCDLGVRWSNTWTLSNGSMEDPAMESEAN